MPSSRTKPGLEKSGRLVAICDQKIFFGDQIIGRGGQ